MVNIVVKNCFFEASTIDIPSDINLTAVERLVLDGLHIKKSISWNSLLHVIRDESGEVHLEICKRCKNHFVVKREFDDKEAAIILCVMSQ